MTITAAELDAAIRENNGLSLCYQPILNVRTGRIDGAEALLRWHHRDFGPLSPTRIIPLAEQAGLINKLGIWVLSEVCRQHKANPDCTFSVNISPLQLEQEGFADSVITTLNNAGCDSEKIEIEITENHRLKNTTHARKHIYQLREQGITVSLDDFGAGYADIHYLYQYEFDKVKIDKSLITQICTNKKNGLLVESLIRTMHEMTLSVTVEGVETEQQLRTLTALQCDRIQGFLISRPITADQLTAFIHTYRR
ncbi:MULTISPECIES: EAL domain-containing protein [Dickeya]|uniref:EAL domain-containing protein n=1 Tax=Dickeya TaxID=204037 RepID=UPI00039F73D7|nr:MULTISPECIES: EAL domain-containing protein [Dickeya]WKV49341.1 EAL domain-containing protein [Dickeya fangzhongdai]